jgi:hypothetical protein
MGEEFGPFHRRGGPGGPGARVASLPVQGRTPDGAIAEAELWAAEEGASEVALLRTICQELGVAWGEDEFGWWAAIPSSLRRA